MLDTKNKFKTKAGKLTRYAFSCGYVEQSKGLSLYMEHTVYHVRGFRNNSEGKECHIVGDFGHVTEARKFMAHPFTHKPTYSGSCIITPTRTG